MDMEAVRNLAYQERVKTLFGYFAEQRVRNAVAETEPGVWEVFRHDEAIRILGDHEAFRSDKRSLIPEDQPHLAMVARGNFIGIDPPQHTVLRSLVSSAFTPRMVGRLQPWVEQHTRVVLDQTLALGGDSFDLVQDFSSRLSAAVIAELFGIPDADHERFWSWSNGLLGSRPFGALGQVDEQAMRRLADVVEEATEYAHAHIRARRRDPGDDLTSALTRVEVDGHSLTDDEIMGMIGMFLIAGHLSTSTLIANTMMCLDEHPEAMAAVRADRSLLPEAVEEVLRWRPPLLRDQRVAARDIEVSGTVIPQGAFVCIWLASANRDERRFTDGERFDLHRPDKAHRAFGHGVHHCLGAPLARLETQAGMTALLDRFPQLSVLRDGGVEFHPSIGILGPVRLPVTVTGGNL